MRILAIGDPHGDLGKVRAIPLEDIDLILLTGDIGKADLMRKMYFANIERKKQGLPELDFSPTQEKRAFMEAYNSTIRLVRYLARRAPVYIVFGNVESSNSETRKQSKKINVALPLLYDNLNLIEGVRVINNRAVDLHGIRIGGLEYFTDVSWVREFKPSDFEKKMRGAKKDTQKAKESLDRFGKVDILLCHQPPYGILDEVTAKYAPKDWQGKHAGSKTLLNYIRRRHPTYVFCGHIHEGEGTKEIFGSNVSNLGVAGYKVIDIDCK
jgi:Icc-related predicted phosphoesterase